MDLVHWNTSFHFSLPLITLPEVHKLLRNKRGAGLLQINPPPPLNEHESESEIEGRRQLNEATLTRQSLPHGPTGRLQPGPPAAPGRRLLVVD